MSILFASLESTDVESEIVEEDPESNQTGKNYAIVTRKWITTCIFTCICVFYFFIYGLVLLTAYGTMVVSSFI